MLEHGGIPGPSECEDQVELYAAQHVSYSETSALAGEVGVVDVSHAKVTVTLSRSYTRPVVIAGVLGMEGGAPTVMRIASVSSNSFEMWTQEQDCANGNHAVSSVPWLVLESGVQGIGVQTGTAMSAADFGWQTVSCPRRLGAIKRP